jgi:LmbE family N-acetylglucosaminyl deacetylase
LRRPKEFVRLLASQLCQLALRCASRPYVAGSGSTLVFAPHPDDETLGCGALIARKRNGGHTVHVVFFTDGAASHPAHPRVTTAEIAAIRAQESRRVLAALGVDSTAVHFLNQADGALNRLDPVSRAAVIARTAALLDSLQPGEIFLPSHADGSSEHEAAFAFVAEAVARCRPHAAIWEYPVWLWWNPLTLLAQVVKATGRCRAPTEDFLDVKRHALALYRSQLAPLPPQAEPALPRDLLRLIDTEAEYFFRSTLLDARPAGGPRPII